MVSVDSIFTTFNEFFRLQMDAFEARGESSSALMVYFFKGHLAAQYKELSFTSNRKKRI